MSKRYGRNQKRRHREEISRLKIENKTERARLEDSERTRAYLKAQARSIVEIIEKICTGSACLPPREFIHRQGGKQMTRRMPIDRERECFPVRGGMVPNVFSSGFVDVHALDIYLQEHREEMKAAIHLQYGDGEGHSAYMLSVSALMARPAYEIEKEIAPMIAAELLSLLRRGVDSGMWRPPR